MLKKIVFIGLVMLLSPCVGAQEVFWGYDENNKELIVPPECDNTFDSQELYEVGMRLLEETGYAKQGASYCLLAAALDNHTQAQFQVARLYQKGVLLPKSDLAAYKWATLAALNGSAEADHLGATIEQFLSIDDIQASTASLEKLIPVIAEVTQKDLDTESAKQEKIKEQIAVTKQEVKDLRKYGRILPRAQKKKAVDDKGADEVKQGAAEKPSLKKKTTAKKSILSKARKDASERAKPSESIFSAEDLENAPMPDNY